MAEVQAPQSIVDPPQKLDKAFNKMLLLTTNLLAGDVPVLPEAADDNDNNFIDALRVLIDRNIQQQPVIEHINGLKLAYEQRLNSSSVFNSSTNSRKECIDYDLTSLNGEPGALSEDAKIAEIAKLFYKIVLEIHFFSLRCINESRSRRGDVGSGVLPPPVGGVLFTNPLFNAYDGAFHGADGIHDAEPRGDMTGSEIVPKKGNKPAKGGWKVVENEIGKDSRDKLIQAIRTSSIKPTEAQSDDITKSIKWDSLNKTTGHHLLDPVESVDRLVCNVVLPEMIKLTSAEFLNFGNRFKVIKVTGPKVKNEESSKLVEKTSEKVRKEYGIGALSNNFAISDCSGPTPEELHALVASSNSTPTIDDVEDAAEDDDDDDDEVEGGGVLFGGGKSKGKKKGPRGRVTAILSHMLDSSKGNSAGGLGKLQQIPALSDFNEYVTFFLPHTRWRFVVKQGNNPAKDQILHILQRVIIDFTKKGSPPKYKIRFEAWRTASANASQAYPKIFLSKSDFFELTEKDKCPGVNETIRYIFSTDFVDKNKKTKPKDLADRYIEKMFPEKNFKGKDPREQAKETRVFFNKFLKACVELIERMPPVVIPGQPVPAKFSQYLGDASLFKMAFLFRQKTMGDFLRLADTAYLNEILWVYNNKLGIAVEGTCDGYSGIKAMASNNCPVFLSEAKEWGKSYTMFSSLTMNKEDAKRAEILDRKTNYIEKTKKLNVTLEELQRNYYRFKTTKIDETLERVYLNMKEIFALQGKFFLEKGVVGRLLSLNDNIIRYTAALNDALQLDSTLQIKKANYEINDSKFAIDQIADSVENVLAILGLFLLLNTFAKNWLSYCEQFLEKYKETINDFNHQIDYRDVQLTDDRVVQDNSRQINKCISLMPSTNQLDKLVTFMGNCNKVSPNWSTEPSSVQELTSEMLTVNAKKKDSKLKKIVDKGIPDFLSQEKNTTVSYASLVNYKQVLSELKDMFDGLKTEVEDLKEPPLQVDIPEINLIFSSGILNQAVEGGFILWYESLPIAVVPPIVVAATPVANQEAEEEAREEAEEVEELKKPEEIKQIKDDLENKKISAPKINKFLSAVKAVTSCNYLLRSLKSFRVLRSSRVVPLVSGGQKGGGVDFQNLLSGLIASANQAMASESEISKDFTDIGDYLPLLYGNEYNSVEQPNAEATVCRDKILEELKETDSEPLIGESYLVDDNLSEIMSSSLGGVENSFDELVVSSNYNGSEEDDNYTNGLVDAIDGFNDEIIEETNQEIGKFLDKIQGFSKKAAVDFIKAFLSGSTFTKPDAIPDDADDETKLTYDTAKIKYDTSINGIYSLLNILLKFTSELGVQIGNELSLILNEEFTGFLNKEKNTTYTFRQAFVFKLKTTFSILIDPSNPDSPFNKIFSEIIPSIFFRNSNEVGGYILRKRIIYFVIRDIYGIEIQNNKLDDIDNRLFFELLTVMALLYDDSLLTSSVVEFYFKSSGTAQLVLPPLNEPAASGEAPPLTQGQIVDFYEGKVSGNKREGGYYNDFLEGKNKSYFPIPLEPTCIPFLLLTKCEQGESSSLKDSVGTFSSICQNQFLRPLIEYFWNDWCSDELKLQIMDSIKYRLILQNRTGTDKKIVSLLVNYLYCYLFGSCKNDKNHNGVIIDDVPGEIIELNLVQYTIMRDRKYLMRDRKYLSYSAAELQDMVKQFMNLPLYERLPEEGKMKTPAEWNAWATGVPANAVKLPGREETTQDLMAMFTGDVLRGVVSNYSYFSKKQKRELGIDDLLDGTQDQKDANIKTILGAKPRTLMELFNIVLYRVAIINIENVNVAKSSLLSEKIGSYLSNPEELFLDIGSGIDLDDPLANFYNFFVSLFTVNPDDKFDANYVTKLDRFLQEIFSRCKTDPEFKNQLRKIVSSREDVMNNIMAILRDPTSKKLTSFFGRQIQNLITVGTKESKALNEKQYVKFLTSLLPSNKLKELKELEERQTPPPKGGKKTHKNMKKMKNRSYHRRSRVL